VGVVKRRVLQGLWRRLVGVGIIGPEALRAPDFIMPLAALCGPPPSAAFALLPSGVARDCWWCDHDYPRWGGHTLEMYSYNFPRARRTGFYHRVGASPLSSGPYRALSRPATKCYRSGCRGSFAT
jgi:hypothetical protein